MSAGDDGLLHGALDSVGMRSLWKPCGLRFCRREDRR